MDLLNWKISYMENTHSSWPSLILIVLFRSKDIHGAGSSYSDIHDREVLDSLSDRPWKEKEGWNANIRLLSRPIVPILGTSSAKVTEWGSRQSLKRTMYFICWVTGGHFTIGFYCLNLPLCDSCWSIYSGGGCRADDFKADSPFIR